MANIYHRTAGSGPPVLLLHGLFGASDNLAGIASILSEHFSVFSLDLPNHGFSHHTESMSLQSMAADIIHWMDESRIQQTAVVGHSLGGKVAMEMALTKPTRVERLVVLDIAPVKYPPRHSKIIEALKAVDLLGISSRKQADNILNEHGVENAFERGFLLKNLVKKDKTFMWKMNLDCIARDYLNLLCHNALDKEFKAPTLFIKGENSDYLSREHWPQVQTQFPEADVRVISGTGHYLHVEEPQVVASTIKKFLKDNTANRI